VNVALFFFSYVLYNSDFSFRNITKGSKVVVVVPRPRSRLLSLTAFSFFRTYQRPVEIPLLQRPPTLGCHHRRSTLGTLHQGPIISVSWLTPRFTRGQLYRHSFWKDDMDEYSPLASSCLRPWKQQDLLLKTSQEKGTITYA